MQKNFAKTCIEELELSGKHFPKAEVLLSAFGYASGACKPLEDVIEERFSTNEDYEFKVEEIVRVQERYQNRKRELNSMDFDDMLVFALQLFQDNQDIRERYSKQFEYVLVDEYQDTNAIQAQWIELLSAYHKNLMVVGDDFQCIYSWRGADFRNIIDFAKKHDTDLI